MMSRLGVWFMGVLARLPLPVLRGMGWVLGQVAYAVEREQAVTLGGHAIPLVQHGRHGHQKGGNRRHLRHRP